MNEAHQNARLCRLRRRYGVELVTGSVPVIPTGDHLPGTAAETEAADSPRRDHLARFVGALRRTVAIATLIVPFTYMFYMLVAAGVLRAELIPALGLTGFVDGLVFPAEFVGHKLFAVSTLYRGVDLWLVGWIALVFVLRSILLSPFNRLETWAGQRAGKESPGEHTYAVARSARPVQTSFAKP